MSFALLTLWLRRSSPGPRQLAAAIGLSVLAAATSITLFGGSGLLVGRAAEGGGLAALGGLLVLIELVAFLRAPLRYEERMVSHRVALASMVRWRVWLYNTVAERVPGSLTELASGDLLDRSIEDIDALQDLYVRIAFPALNTLVTGLLASLAAGLLLGWAGVLLGLGVVCGFGIALTVGRRSGLLDGEIQGARGLVSSRTVDLLLGMTDLTMAGATKDALAAITLAEHHRARSSRRRADLRGFGIALEVIVVGAVLLGLIALCGHATKTGHLTAAEAACVVLIGIAGLEPLSGLLAAAVRVPEVAESARRLESLEGAPIAAAAPREPRVWPECATFTLDHVVVTIGSDNLRVLEGTSLTIPPGSHIAILGASGAGKSTLCQVLLRFLDPTTGAVSIGATPYVELDGDEVRTHVALLDQSPFLFGGSVRDILALGDSNADDEQLLDVLRRCELMDLAESEAAVLDLRIAEDGSTLSGGQQRRLALARALLRRPELLLLDEPTAGLDSAQAATVMRSCLDAIGANSVVLVTHDRALTEGFDQVLWLEGGVLTPLRPEPVA